MELITEFEFELPKGYVDENGEKRRPYIIHRTSIGCYERTIALLIEKYAGAFPLWIAPTQVKVISLTDRNAESAKQIADKLYSYGLRTELDDRSETVGYKIRSAQLEKVPYMIVIGDKEAESGVVSVRRRGEGVIGEMSLDDFIARLQKEIAEKRLD